MCDPVSIGMGVMGVAGAASSYMGASDAAQAQGEHNRRLGIWQNEKYNRAVDYQQQMGRFQADRYYKTVASIQESTRGQYNTVLEQIDQVRGNALNEISKAHQASRQGKSFITAAASETGTTGNSIRMAQQQYELAEARFTHLTYENLKNRVKQSERNMDAIRAQSLNMANQAMPAPMAPLDPVQPIQQVESPSMLPYIIQGGSAVLGAAAHSQTISAISGPSMLGSGGGGVVGTIGGMGGAPSFGGSAFA